VRRLLACMPCDRSKLPQIPELDAIVVTDLYTLRQCEACSQAVWVGPRQMAEYTKDPEEFFMLCYICAIVATQMITGSFNDDSVEHLGGGYPVEGRARVT